MSGSLACSSGTGSSSTGVEGGLGRGGLIKVRGVEVIGYKH